MLGRFFSGLRRVRFRLSDCASAAIAKATFAVCLLIGWARSGFRVFGVYQVKCYNKRGELRWTAFAPNAVVNVGLNYLLGSALASVTQITIWYLGLVDNASFTAFAAGDTMASHAGWIEVTTYDESTRVTWTPTTPVVGQSATNPSTSNFTMNATKTVKGLFLTSVSTKGGTTGTLFSEAAFSGGNQTVNDDDVLQVTYTANATSS